MSGTVFSTPGATGGAVATPVVDSTGAVADLTAAKTPEQIMATLDTQPAAATPPVTPPAEVAKTPEQDAAEAATAAAEAAKGVVPEKYEFKAPDGVTFDQAQIDAFTPIAKELGLTNDQAQKLVDFHTATVTNANAAVVQARVTETAKWGEQSAADPDFGGVKFKENTGIAVKTLDKFGTPALRQALDASGMGNHPEVFRLLWKIGKSISEDAFSSGNGGGGGAPRVSAAKSLFPNLPD